ncbi:MAG TPA: S41 family peptidase [Candidatus Dormibacteraeota bacterium]|nr:S41 family peptidase [Candidatus Dormibacteraeota bacterium]
MSRPIRIAVFSFSVLVLLYVSFGYVFGQSKQDRSYRSLTVYGEVLDRIQQDYVDQPNLRSVTTGGLHGLLEALDPESSYFSPQEYAEWKTETAEHAKGSVGLNLSRRGYIFVISTLPGSPALKASIHEGDVVEAIAGYTTQDMSVQQAQLLLDGPPGSTVKVAIVHRSSPKPENVDLTRVIVPQPPLLITRFQGDVGYIRVASFDQGTAKGIRGKLKQFQRQGVHKLILDLRECASGEDAEAIDTAQLFLNAGTIATLRGQTIATETFSADPSKVAWRDPVSVLVSGSTAGPAEILAAAIAGNHRGSTVGQNTLGLASEQKMIPLEDGSAIYLTVGIYYTPSGKAILNNGLAPTVQVPPPNSQTALLDAQDIAPDPVPGELPPPTDPLVKKAIEILNAGQSADKAATSDQAPRPASRYPAFHRAG